MPSYAIPNFKFGLDQRRPRVAGAVSTLWDAKNCHITRGGDIERSKAFVPAYTLPAGAFGLTAVGSRLFTFGSLDLAATMPAGMNYQRLVPETAANMVGVLVAVAFIGNTYVIAEYDDGNVRHFYNAARVTDWDAISDSNSSVTSLADYLSNKVNGDSAVEATAYANTVLVTSRVAGVSDTITASAVNNGADNTQSATVAILQAAVPAVAETRATGTITILSGTSSPGINRFSQAFVGAVPLLLAPVDWIGSNSATANAVAVQINNLSTTSGYAASSVGPVITITAAPGAGASPNGGVVTTTLAGNVGATTTNIAGGVTAIVAVAQIASVALGGLYEAKDLYTITVNGNAYLATGRASGAGLSAFVFTNRIYSCANTHLKYCKINDPTNWTDATASSGAGFINIASQTNGSERLSAVESYASYAAIFSPQSVRLYSLTADATTVSFFQTMRGTGSIAPLSLQAYANTDVFYLDSSGVRSLRQHDTSFTAYAADVGAAIDTPLQAWIVQVGSTVAFNAVSAIEPLDNRYWVAIGSRIWVYSFFPSTEIGGWSYYDPGISISAFAKIKKRLYCIAGNVVYLYGGLTGQVYPAAGVTPVSFTTPFLNPADPELQKDWTSVDVGAAGVWKITVFPEANNLGATINGGTIVNSTFAGDAKAVVGHSKLFSLQMDCASAGYANFSNFIANYTAKN